MSLAEQSQKALVKSGAIGLDDEQKAQVTTWVEKAVKSPKSITLPDLDTFLLTRVFLVGRSWTVADSVVAAAVSAQIAEAAAAEDSKFLLVNVLRWFDLVQKKFGFGEGVKVPAVAIVLDVPEDVELEVEKKEDDEKTGGKDDKKKKKKDKAAERAAKEADAAKSEVSAVDIRVGKIVGVEAHPTNADLYVEKIDLGEPAPRQIVSGLAKFVPIEAMKDRLVVVICNLSEAEIHGVKSNGLVLCASNEEHTAVEPLVPAAGSTPGEKIVFAGVEGEIDTIVNPKKFRKIIKKFTTSSDDVPKALYMDIPFTTSKGIVTVPSLKAANVK